MEIIIQEAIGATKKENGGLLPSQIWALVEGVSGPWSEKKLRRGEGVKTLARGADAHEVRSPTKRIDCCSAAVFSPSIVIPRP